MNRCRLTFVSNVEKKNNKLFALYKCQCGNMVIKRKDSVGVKNGTLSCGCLSKEIAPFRNRTHGMKKTRQYGIWTHIAQRTDNPKNKMYKHYGGRGIKVCDKWRTFEGFWEDMKDGYQDTLSLDRIDNNGNYEKSNCRWATEKMQKNNTSKNLIVEYDNQKYTFSEFCDKFNLKYDPSRRKYRKGKTLEEILYDRP